MSHITKERAVELAKKANILSDVDLLPSNQWRQDTVRELHAFAEAVAAEVLSQQVEPSHYVSPEGLLYAAERAKFLCLDTSGMLSLFTRPPATVNQQLVEALKKLIHAVHEIHHANTNPRWFTGGERAAYQHQITWITKAADISNEARAALAAAETAPDHSELVKRLRECKTSWPIFNALLNEAADALEGK